MTFRSTVVKPYLLDLQDLVEPQGSIESAKPVPLLAKPQSLPKAKLQLPPNQGRGRLYKYLLLTAVINMAVIDAIKDISAFTGNIINIADITIYL